MNQWAVESIQCYNQLLPPPPPTPTTAVVTYKEQETVLHSEALISGPDAKSLSYKGHSPERL